VSSQSITLGRLELRPILDGYFALDGGAMFGVVPKTLWSRVAAPDDRRGCYPDAVLSWPVL